MNLYHFLGTWKGLRSLRSQQTLFAPPVQKLGVETLSCHLPGLFLLFVVSSLSLIFGICPLLRRQSFCPLLHEEQQSCQEGEEGNTLMSQKRDGELDPIHCPSRLSHHPSLLMIIPWSFSTQPPWGSLQAPLLPAYAGCKALHAFHRFSGDSSNHKWFIVQCIFANWYFCLVLQ